MSFVPTCSFRVNIRSSGVQLGEPMGPAIFCLALRPGLKRFRDAFEEEGVGAAAYMVDVSLGVSSVTAK